MLYGWKADSVSGYLVIFLFSLILLLRSIFFLLLVLFVLLCVVVVFLCKYFNTLTSKTVLGNGEERAKREEMRNKIIKMCLKKNSGNVFLRAANLPPCFRSINSWFLELLMLFSIVSWCLNLNFVVSWAQRYEWNGRINLIGLCLNRIANSFEFQKQFHAQIILHSTDTGC